MEIEDRVGNSPESNIAGEVAVQEVVRQRDSAREGQREETILNGQREGAIFERNYLKLSETKIPAQMEAINQRLTEIQVKLSGEPLANRETVERVSAALSECEQKLKQANEWPWGASKES